MHFSTETATEQRSEFASNPGWNHLIATMKEEEFPKSFSVICFSSKTQEKGKVNTIVLRFQFRSGLITTFPKSFSWERVVKAQS